MRTYLNLILLLAIGASISSCFSAKPIVILEANDIVGQWFFGQQIIRIEEEDIDLSVAYERESPFEITMNMRIINNTDDDVLVDPKAFYYNWYRNEMDSLPAGRVYAENPELRLVQIDYDISANRAAQGNRAIFDLVATTAEITADVVSVANDWEEEKKEKLQVIKESRRGLSHVVAASQSLKSMSLNDQRKVWSRDVLRKTTLSPGQSLDGKVIFKPSVRSKRCRFIFPVGHANIMIDFKQRLYKQVEQIEQMDLDY